MTPTNSVFVDTSGWATPVVRDTPNYQALEAFSRTLVTGARPLVTTNYVITELVALLTIRTRLSRPEILHFVNQIKPLAQIIYIDAALDAAAWALLEQYDDKEWSLVDAASFVVMRQLDVTEAFTTDQHFLRAGFVRVPIQ
jgi:predicted nucleic acid-binding protein